MGIPSQDSIRGGFFFWGGVYYRSLSNQHRVLGYIKLHPEEEY